MWLIILIKNRINRASPTEVKPNFKNSNSDFMGFIIKYLIKNIKLTPPNFYIYNYAIFLL